MPYQNHNTLKQAGFTLLEMLLVLAIGMTAMVMYMEQKMQDFHYMEARELGVQIAQYNNAVRSWLANNSTDTSLFRTYNGTAWLKSRSCGGSVPANQSPYLPCSFQNTTKLGNLTFSTVVSNNPAAFSSTAGRQCASSGYTTSTSYKTVCAETAFRPLILDGKPASSLAGLAAMVAAGGSSSYALANQSRTTVSYGSNPRTAVITMLASTNPGIGPWLRTDGGNTMASGADIRWAGIPINNNGQNEIIGVDRIYNMTKSGVKGLLHLGDNSTYASQANVITSGVVVDSDAQIKGNLTVNGNLNVDKNITVNGTVKAQDFLTDAGQKLSMAIDYATIIDAAASSAGRLVPKPTCKSGLSPSIYVTPTMFSTDNTAYPIAAVQTWATNYNANDWQVNMRILTQNGATTPNRAGYGKLLVLTGCQ